MAASFQKVFMNDPAALKPPISEEQGSSGDGGALLMTPADLVKELLSGTSTCEELGRQSFAFFEVKFVFSAGLNTPAAVGFSLFFGPCLLFLVNFVQ